MAQTSMPISKNNRGESEVSEKASTKGPESTSSTDREQSKSAPRRSSTESSKKGGKEGRGGRTGKDRGVELSRHYTHAEKDPLEKVHWEKRSSVITNPDGSIVFRMTDAEVPQEWSQLATDIAVSKYFRKAGLYGKKDLGETSVRQLVFRLARTIREAADQLGGYFATETDADTFEAELSYMLVHQVGAFNSPVWFNVGLYQRYGIEGSGGNFAWNSAEERVVETRNAYEQPQASACFIQSVPDDLMGIYEAVKNEARLFKHGSGVGSNFSAIRAHQEKLSGGGTSSGLMSFLEVFDRAAGATKSGGTTRRAAKMVCLDMDHPEIKEFITWKSTEEKKAHALIRAGYSADFNGEAYHTISGQNSNNSVRVTDDFMHAVERGGKWQTIARTTGEVVDTFDARELWNMIADAAWGCADPGVQYDTTINKWHTVPNSGRINASNPCSEYMHLDDSACNLSSLNLTKFLRSDGSFDVEFYRHAIRVFFIAQEILIDFASYPTKQIAQNSHDFRPLGLGYANLGSMLMILGIPYDSDEGRAWASALTAILSGHAYRVSAEMAASKGPFPGFLKNREPMLKVMKMHKDEAYQIDRDLCPETLWRAACADWDDAVNLGSQHGFRNAQATVLAPTGCLVGGSLIATDRGLVRLRTLGDTAGAQWQEVDLKVATDEGAKTATKFYINGRERVVTIETGSGYRIEGTPTHRIKVVDPASGEWVWKRFAEVKEGDRVPLALNQILGVPQQVSLPSLPGVYPAREEGLRTPHEMTVELAEFIGYFMGNGSLHTDGLRLHVNTQDTDVIERLVGLGQKLFQLDARCSTDQKTTIVDNFTTVGESTTVTFSSTRLPLWWEACGFSTIHDGPQGKGYLPHLPDALLASNDPAIYKAFLRGLFEAGEVHSAGYPTWSTTQLDLSFEVQQLLLALGLPSMRRMSIEGSSVHAALHLSNFLSSSRFAREIGFVSARKRAAIKAAESTQTLAHDSIPVTRALIDRLTMRDERLRPELLAQHTQKGTISRKLAEDLQRAVNDTELEKLLGFFYDQVSQAELGGERLTYDLSVPENVTYLANGFVSHNTIGLLMDCDTTGVEPDFALVKFKKLAGGGYFKIVNQSVPAALESLGYRPEQVQEIVAYVTGTNTLLAAPHINRATLREKGFSDEELRKIEDILPGLFDLESAFSPWVLGEDSYRRLLGASSQRSLLKTLGFSAAQIEEANNVVVGRMTIEGAPHLKQEHYPIFDCANRCGKHGKRFLPPMSHIKMMAAVQPFLSGAISKTVNLPNDATVDDVREIYEAGWKLGLKAVALYRDGCKASQPLSTTSEEKEEESAKEEKPRMVATSQEAPTTVPSSMPIRPVGTRVRLPKKRTGFTQEARVGGHKIFLRTGEYADGSLGEIFIDMHKEGAAFRSVMNCLAMAVSVGLQYGVPLDTYVEQFTFTRFEPQGQVDDHPNIKLATSIVDYIFRVLGVEYLERYDLAHVKPDPKIKDPNEAWSQRTPAILPENPAPSSTSLTDGLSGSVLDQQLENMMGDAPVCDSCGHITVRNGACYKCLNCGNSMGCS